MTLKQRVPTAPAGNEWVVSLVGNLTGAGTSSQANALAIALGQDGSLFTTVAANSGCRLPAGVSVGEEYVIANHGTNALLVYPPSGGFMGTASQNAAYSLAAGKTGYFMAVGLLTFTVNP